MAEQPFELPDGTLLPRTASVGFAVFPLQPGQPHASTWEDAVELSDQSLYFAKRHGRNTWAGLVTAHSVEGLGQRGFLEGQMSLGGFRVPQEAGVCGAELDAASEV